MKISIDWNSFYGLLYVNVEKWEKSTYLRNVLRLMQGTKECINIVT